MSRESRAVFVPRRAMGARRLQYWCAFLVLLHGIALMPAAPVATAAETTPTALPADTRVPGGLALLPLKVQGDDPGAVYFGVHRAPVVHAAAGWIAIVGIPLDSVPGPQAARW